MKRTLIREAADHHCSMFSSDHLPSSEQSPRKGLLSAGSCVAACVHRFNNSRQIYRRHARAVLVDMEPKVVNRAVVSAASSSANWCYAPGCCFSQQSGSGNNWARGYNSYGPTFASTVCELVRREVRLCPLAWLSHWACSPAVK